MKRSEMIEKMQELLEMYVQDQESKEICTAMLEMMEEEGLTMLTWKQITEISNPSISGWPIRSTTRNEGSYGWEEE